MSSISKLSVTATSSLWANWFRDASIVLLSLIEVRDKNWMVTDLHCSCSKRNSKNCNYCKRRRQLR